MWLWTYHIPSLAQLPLHHAPSEPYSPGDAFDAFINQACLLNKDRSRVVDAKKLISAWFYDAPFTSIRLGNLTECLAHGFYFMSPSEMRTKLGLDAAELSSRYAEAAGLRIPPGYRHDLRCLVKTMIEPMQCGHRPLLFYLAMEIIAVISGLYMTFVLGFRLVRSKENSSVRFYSRQGQGSTTLDNPPVLVMHGIGLGLLTYLPTITQITADAASSDRPVLCLEIPHISMRFRFSNQIPTIRQVAEDVNSGLVDMNVPQVSLLAHSYSTCVASSLLHHHPQVLHSACLIDPVAFGSYLPPRPLAGKVRFSSLRDFLMDLFVIMVIREPHQACTWYRRFYWPEATVNHLTFFPCPTAFALGGQDHMIHNVSEVKEMVELTDARVLFHPSHAHGGVLGDRDMQSELLSYL